MPKRIALAGASGSIGQQTLEVCRRHPDKLKIELLAVHTKTAELDAWIDEFAPGTVCVTDEVAAAAYLPAAGVTYLHGHDSLREAVTSTDYDLLVNGIVGAAGLAPSYHALSAGHHVATANKESLVIGGELLTRTAHAHGVNILPIDSEHSAIWQCLRSGREGEVDRLWLTGSGGPFRTRPLSTFDSITVEEALGHPTWQMGGKITIDSATMMNKGFEIIEARWLFDIPTTQIEVVIHPESIVHSAVCFSDGSVIAQMGHPDMHLPIQYALLHPERHGPSYESLDLRELGTLHFEAPDPDRFPALALARVAMDHGGSSPIVLNAANEVAVQAFIGGQIPFPAITECVAAQLERAPEKIGPELDDILDVDTEARNGARAWLAEHFNLSDHLISDVD